MKKLLLILFACPFFAQAQSKFSDYLKTAESGQIIPGKVDSATVSGLHFVRKDSPFTSLYIPWRQVASLYVSDTAIRRKICTATQACNRLVNSSQDMAMNSLGKVDRTPIELNDSLARIALSHHIYDAGSKIVKAETATLAGIALSAIGSIVIFNNQTAGAVLIGGGGVLSLSAIFSRMGAGKQLKEAGQKIRYLKK